MTVHLVSLFEAASRLTLANLQSLRLLSSQIILSMVDSAECLTNQLCVIPSLLLRPAICDPNRERQRHQQGPLRLQDELRGPGWLREGGRRQQECGGAPARGYQDQPLSHGARESRRCPSQQLGSYTLLPLCCLTHPSLFTSVQHRFLKL